MKQSYYIPESDMQTNLENDMLLTEKPAMKPDAGIVIWRYFSWAIFFDILFFFLEYTFHVPLGIVIGSFVFLAIFLFGALRQNIRFNFPQKAVVYWIYLLIPFLTGIFSYPDSFTNILSLYVKFSIYLFVFMILSVQNFDCLPWDDFQNSKFLLGILIFLSMSTVFAPYYGNNQLDSISGIEIRPSGFFKNSNIAAPIAFLQLFMIPSRKKFVSAIIYFCAILALLRINSNTTWIAIALTAMYYLVCVRKNYAAGIFFLLAAGIIATIFNDRFLIQIETAFMNMDSILTDSVNYGLIGNETSLTWRLTHWIKLISAIFSDDSILAIMFGHGLASTIMDNGILPHNEYLRILYEEGVIGFLLFCAVGINAFREASPKGRTLLVCYAVFMFSENALDTFSAFIIFLTLLSYDIACNKRKVLSHENIDD